MLLEVVPAALRALLCRFFRPGCRYIDRGLLMWLPLAIKIVFLVRVPCAARVYRAQLSLGSGHVSRVSFRMYLLCGHLCSWVFPVLYSVFQPSHHSKPKAIVTTMFLHESCKRFPYNYTTYPYQPLQAHQPLLPGHQGQQVDSIPRRNQAGKDTRFRRALLGPVATALRTFLEGSTLQLSR